MNKISLMKRKNFVTYAKKKKKKIIIIIIIMKMVKMHSNIIKLEIIVTKQEDLEKLFIVFAI